LKICLKKFFGSLKFQIYHIDDDQLWKSPLDEIYAELGISSSGLLDSRPSLFPVYTPKSSTEYFSTATANPSSIPSHRSSALGTYRVYFLIIFSDP